MKWTPKAYRPRHGRPVPKSGPQPAHIREALQRVVKAYSRSNDLDPEVDRRVEADLAAIMKFRDPARWVWFMTMFPTLRSAPKSATEFMSEEDESDEQ